MNIALRSVVRSSFWESDDGGLQILKVVDFNDGTAEIELRSRADGIDLSGIPEKTFLDIDAGVKPAQGKNGLVFYVEEFSAAPDGTFPLPKLNSYTPKSTKTAPTAS